MGGRCRALEIPAVPGERRLKELAEGGGPLPPLV